MIRWLKSRLTPKPPYARYIGIEGWLTPAEAEGLYQVASSVPENCTVLEIGSWKGKSTYCIATGMKSGRIHCIDPFNADGEPGSKELYQNVRGQKTLLEQFRTNLSEVSPSVTIIPLVGYSKDFVGTIGSIDLLFIDGDHSIEGCRYDFEHYSDCIRLGGFLAFHDYDSTRKDLGPTWVIDQLVRTNPSYCFIRNFDTLMVFKKHASRSTSGNTT